MVSGKIKAYLTGFALGVGVSGLTLFTTLSDDYTRMNNLEEQNEYLRKENEELDIRGNKDLVEKAYPVPDLNHDGKNDLVLESIGGYKTPLFINVKEDGSIEYLCSDKMKHIFYARYVHIEDKLNEK